MTTTPAGSRRGWTLRTLPGCFAVCRLEPDAPVPELPGRAALYCVTRTADELSIVCREDAVPSGVRAETGWRCMKVDGPIPFEVTGVVASLTSPLAAAGIPVFVLSTFDTDYLLVKEPQLGAAAAALRQAGHGISTEMES